MFSCSSKQKSRRSSLSKLFGRKNKRRGGSQKHGFKRFSEPVPRHGTHVDHVCVYMYKCIHVFNETNKQTCTCMYMYIHAIFNHYFFYFVFFHFVLFLVDNLSFSLSFLFTVWCAINVNFHVCTFTLDRFFVGEV